jgi:hypothetical protein
MKFAVFALLSASVSGQKYSMEESKDAMWKMYKSGEFSMITDLSPKRCTSSRDCGMQYRMGGCCGKVSIVKGAEKVSADLKEMLNGNDSYCMLGSGVESMEMNNGSVSVYDFTKYQFDNDPVLRATYESAMPGTPNTFEEFN